MDLIDRAKVERITFQEPSYSDPINVLTEVRDKVRALPTVEAEPVRHGRLVKNFETAEGRSLRCSRCLMVFWVGHGRDGNYCPNCGAKMDEVEHEID